MNYKVNYLWEQGSRVENEDSLTLMQITCNHIPALFALVADGIGGMSNGEMASGVIANRLKCVFENASYNPATFNLRFLMKALKRELYSCHHDLTAYASDNNISLGSTCSLICIIGHRGFLLHTGDSRIYSSAPKTFFSSSAVRLISKDHIDKNGLLTQCIGHGQYQNLFYRPIHVKRKGIILLCTDGFYRRLQEDIPRISAFINSYSPENCLQYMHSLAIHRGESDNAAAILIQINK